MRFRVIAASAATVLAALAIVDATSAAHAGTAAASAAAPALSGGHATATTRHATVSWKCTGTSAFQVTITGPGPGPVNGQTAKVSKPQAVYSGLQPGHTYSVKIQPLVSGHPAGKSGAVTFRTRYGR